MKQPFHLRFSDIKDLYRLTLEYGLTGYSLAKKTFENIYQVPFSQAIRYFKTLGYPQRFKKEFLNIKKSELFFKKYPKRLF
jgi:hypothetical protein